MKFQSIIIFLVCCTAQIESARTGRLSGQENEDRLKSCGTERLPQPSKTKLAAKVADNGYRWIQNLYNYKSKLTATASFITSRHFLTASDIVMTSTVKTDSLTWLSTSKQLEDKDCFNGKDVEVPETELENFAFDCKPNCPKANLTFVRKAWLLNVCTDGKLREDDVEKFLMVGETNKNLEGVTPCFFDHSIKKEFYDVYATTRSKTNTVVSHRRVSSDSYFDEYLYTENYTGIYHSGEALVRIENDKVILSGVGVRFPLVSPGDKQQAQFFYLKKSFDTFCDLFGICVGGTGALTKEENVNRLANCGKVKLPQEAIDSNPVKVEGYKNTLQLGWWFYVKGEVGYASASMITNRHFITSSMLVLDSNMKWISTAYKYHETCSEGSPTYIQVPPQVLKTLSVMGKKGVQLGRAFIIWICKDSIGLGKNGYPMIVEVKDKRSSTTVCLNSEWTVKIDDVLDSYNIGNQKLLHTKLKVTGISTDMIHTEMYEQPQGYEEWGGFLVQQTNSRSNLVGMAPPILASFDERMFFDISAMKDGLCDLIGACDKEEAPTPTSEPLTSSENPSSTSESITTSSESTTEISESPSSTAVSITTTSESTGISENPEASEASVTSELPETSETPETSGTSETSDFPESTETPSVPKIPESTTTPSPPKPTTKPIPEEETEEFKKKVDEEYEAFEEMKRKQKGKEDVDVNNDFFVDPDFLISGIQKTLNFLVFILIFFLQWV